MQEQQKDTKHKKGNAVQRIGIVDTESGEVLDGGKLLYVQKRLRIKGFFMANQWGLEGLARTNLTGEAFRVLMFMMSRMDYENAIRLQQKDIAEALSMKKQNVSRAIKVLRDERIIEHEDGVTLYLSTFYGWKGKVSNKITREAEEERRSKELAALHATQALVEPLGAGS